jgi:hypothetical protein
VRLALALAAAALLASACGGGAKPAASAADVAPFDTYALLSGSPDGVRRALELIPDGRRLVSLLAAARAVTGGGERIALLDPTGRRAVTIVEHADVKALDRAGIAHAEVHGWVVYSRQQASVDAVRKAKRHLVDEPWYRPAEGDVTFVLPWLTLTASRHGDREIAERTTAGAGSDAVQTLAASIPDDAVAAAAFQRGADAFGGLPFGAALQQGLGLRLSDLAAAAPGSGVVFARPAEPIPTVTLLARGGTLAAARRLVRDLDPNAPPPVPAALDGVPLEVVHLSALDLYYGRFEDTLVVTDDPGLRLRSSFTALGPEGVPERTSAWAYLDVASGLPALERLAALAGTPLSQGFVDRVSPLRSVLAYRIHRGERQTLVVVAR